MAGGRAELGGDDSGEHFDPKAMVFTHIAEQRGRPGTVRHRHTAVPHASATSTRWQLTLHSTALVRGGFFFSRPIDHASPIYGPKRSHLGDVLVRTSFKMNHPSDISFSCGRTSAYML